MELGKEVLEFFDKMCDGHGLAKIIFKGGRKGISTDKIRLAAQEVYYQHMAGNKVESLTAARKVMNVAKGEIISGLQMKEQAMARDRDTLLRRIEELERKIVPFRTKLYHWWPNWIYFI